MSYGMSLGAAEGFLRPVRIAVRLDSDSVRLVSQLETRASARFGL